MKRWVAIILAALLGITGIIVVYLGNKDLGSIIIALCVVGAMVFFGIRFNKHLEEFFENSRLSLKNYWGKNGGLLTLVGIFLAIAFIPEAASSVPIKNVFITGISVLAAIAAYIVMLTVLHGKIEKQGLVLYYLQFVLMVITIFLAGTVLVQNTNINRPVENILWITMIAFPIYAFFSGKIRKE